MWLRLLVYCLLAVRVCTTTSVLQHSHYVVSSAGCHLVKWWCNRGGHAVFVILQTEQTLNRPVKTRWYKRAARNKAWKKECYLCAAKYLSKQCLRPLTREQPVYSNGFVFLIILSRVGATVCRRGDGGKQQRWEWWRRRVNGARLSGSYHVPETH